MLIVLFLSLSAQCSLFKTIYSRKRAVAAGALLRMQRTNTLPMAHCFLAQKRSEPSTAQKFLLLQTTFPAAVLKRYMKDFKNTDMQKTLRIRDEWIRYALISHQSTQPIPLFSHDVDQLWHTFLLFNKDYEQFCTQLYGTKKILYHIPRDEGTQIKNTAAQKIAFVENYKKTFLCDPDSTIWKDKLGLALLNDCAACGSGCASGCMGGCSSNHETSKSK